MTAKIPKTKLKVWSIMGGLCDDDFRTPVTISIDPGLQGAYVASQCGEMVCYGPLSVFDPSVFYEIETVYIERPFVLPRQSAAGNASIWMRYGVLLYRIGQCSDAEIVEIQARGWKRFMGLDKDKSKSIALACRKCSVPQFQEDCQKWPDLAEAFLIGEYGGMGEGV